MPYIFVRSALSSGPLQRTTTHIDFHLLFDQSRSHLYRELQKVVSPLNDVTPIPECACHRREDFAYEVVVCQTCYKPGSPGWKTYQTNVPAYVVLNALETCGYKVVAASSTSPSSQYVWTLQGPVDREVDQAHASSFRVYPSYY